MDRRQPAQRPNLHLPTQRCQSTTLAKRCVADAPGRFRWLRSGPRAEPGDNEFGAGGRPLPTAAEAASNSVTGPAKLVKCTCRPGVLLVAGRATRSLTPNRIVPVPAGYGGRNRDGNTHPGHETARRERTRRAAFAKQAFLTPWGTAWCRNPTLGSHYRGRRYPSCRTWPSSRRSDRATRG